MENCHDCGVAPGYPHSPGCDMEKCTVCGIQIIQGCDCEGHNSMVAGHGNFYDQLSEYWCEMYMTDDIYNCPLCERNSGFIKNARGRFPCICPNGVAIQRQIKLAKIKRIK